MGGRLRRRCHRGILLGGVSGVMIPLADVVGGKAFAVCCWEGKLNCGAIVAGIILGVSENIAAGYLDPLLLAGDWPMFSLTS